MRRGSLIGGISAIAIAIAFAVASPANAQQYYGDWYGRGMMGPGMMGPGMMGGYGMMGPGMMGPGMMGMMGPGMMGCPGGGMMMGGYGPGMMGGGYGPQQANLNLSTNDVKSYLERWIAMMGNPHLKAGPVTEKDANTIMAEVVTTDKGDLVQRFNVDRRAGFWQPVQ